MRRHIVSSPYSDATLFDSRIGNIDSWPGLFDGDELNGTECRLYVRATPDDPSGSPTWGAWRQLTNNIIRGRGFQFRLTALTQDSSQNVAVSELGAVLELQQRTETSATLTSGAAQYTATFTNAFYEAPSIGITAQNLATGDYYAIADITRTSFKITFRNSAGTMISRNFQYTAVGYGKEIP